MGFLKRLRLLMDSNGDSNARLAKKSGIPYSTIDGLFKRGWEKAQISTILKICNTYDVSLDYMVHGVEKLSPEALMVAAKYDLMSVYGKTVIDSVVTQEQRFAEVIKHAARKQQDQEERIRRYLSDDAEVMETVHDSVLYARYNAKREARELELEENFKREDVQE